ncbi:MAG: DUF4403 family protein [Chitinispirillia bacterium]|nr:DUF4403 family protein [Chitinispirillia bacterium]
MTAGDEPAAQAAAPIAPIPSTINIPARINLAFIENIVNREINGTIYSNNAFPVENLGTARLSVSKNGRINIRATGNELVYKIPLKISMRFSFSILGHTEYQDVDAGIAINLRTKYTLQNNWRLATTTSVDGYEWTTPPTVKIRFITIPIKPIADFLASRQSGILNEIGKMVDNAVSNGVNIKTQITPLWEQLQTPTEIAAPNMPERLWLRFNPTDIYISQITGLGGSINATIGIRAFAETFTGDKPAQRPPKPLPDFAAPKNQDTTLTINLYAELPFEQATAICREQFVGKTLTSGRQKVLVNDIEISGINGLAKVKMNLSGSIKGNVTVLGRAVYNESTQTLSIDDFDFDIETKSRYQRTRNWLLRGIIISKMKPMMKFPVGEMLEDSKILVQQMLKNYEIHKGITLNGHIQTLTVLGAELTDNAIRAVVIAKGSAKILVRD